MSDPKNVVSAVCTRVDSADAGRYEAWSLFVTASIVPKVGPPLAATTIQTAMSSSGMKTRHTILRRVTRSP